MRAMSDDEGRALKAASRRAVKAAGGGEALSLVSRVSEGQLSKYGLAGDEHRDTFMPIDVALEADREAGSPIIATALAGAQGFRLVAADGEERAEGLGFSDISTANVAFGKLLTSMHEGLANDGMLDEAERRAVLRDLDKFMRIFLPIMGRV